MSASPDVVMRQWFQEVWNEIDARTSGSSRDRGCHIVRGRRFVSCSRGRRDSNRSSHDRDPDRLGPRWRAGIECWSPHSPAVACDPG